MSDEIELTMVTMRFEVADIGAMLAILSKYVVLARMAPGCRNVDLVASATTLGVLLIVQKWDSPDAQRVHFDSIEMREMATSCTGLLKAPPEIDLWEAVSAHDMR